MPISQADRREWDRIQCLECGRWFRALPKHVRHAHDMDDDDYRLKFGIPVSVPLVCEEWSANQSERNRELDLKRTLTARGPSKGFSQRESVKVRQRSNYAALARAGRATRIGRDLTVKRRELLRPYPVTVAQVIERLDCSRSAAYTFLTYCVSLGRLRRTGRGLYDEVANDPEST